MEHVVDGLVDWLRKQVEQAGVKGLVVGVSGGIDSAVVANLIKRACPDNSLGVIMPLNSDPEGMEHAKKVIETCGMKGITVDLAETHEVLFSQIKGQLKGDYNSENGQLADANLRARLRMNTLYTVATNYNYLVVGTDNAAEWYTGYFTKYGDGGVDILPIVDFSKGEVRELAKYLDVPQEVIDKKPSADLWEGQTDEAEMGTTYDTIDSYLKGETIPEADKEIIERMHRNTKHKRDPLPQFSRIN